MIEVIVMEIETQISKILKWRKQQNNISLKLVKTNGVLNRLKYEYLLNILKRISNNLFLPHLYYGILLWSSETENIHKMQKRAVYIISVNRFNAHTEPICRAEQLLFIYTTFIKRCIHKQKCSNAIFNKYIYTQ